MFLYLSLNIVRARVSPGPDQPLRTTGRARASKIRVRAGPDQPMDSLNMSKWGSECYGVDRRCGVAEVKGVTELLGSAELGGVAELSGGPE